VRISLPTKIGLVVGVGVVALAVIWFDNQLSRPVSDGTATASGKATDGATTGAASDGSAGKFKFAVGNPGPGQEAPAINLAASTGGSFDLASQRGKIVLLYFQEGLTCQPCWEQITELEKRSGGLRSLGIDTLVSITTDPIDLIKQRATDLRLSTTVLSDPDLAVSRAYRTNDYGMMGKSRNGHTFILVGPDGKIRWRADYGGAPDYTMYLPAANLLADIARGITTAAK